MKLALNFYLLSCTAAPELLVEKCWPEIHKVAFGALEFEEDARF